MKVLAGLVLAVAVSVSASVASAGEFDSIVPGKTAVVFNTERTISRPDHFGTYKKTLVSRENGKKCELSYTLYKIQKAVIPGGAQAVVAFNPSGTIPNYGFYIVANSPYGQGEQLIFACQSGLNLAQVSNLLAEDGIELRDL